MEQSARTSGRRSVGMHVGRRFGDVLVCLEADEELTWFFNQAGEQIVSKTLSLSPTLTIRPGFPLRVLVTRDLVLEPYRE